MSRVRPVGGSRRFRHLPLTDAVDGHERRHDFGDVGHLLDARASRSSTAAAASAPSPHFAAKAAMNSSPVRYRTSAPLPDVRMMSGIKSRTSLPSVTWLVSSPHGRTRWHGSRLDGTHCLAAQSVQLHGQRVDPLVSDRDPTGRPQPRRFRDCTSGARAAVVVPARPKSLPWERSSEL